MEEITITHLVEKAKDFHMGGKEWHFHTLTPDCIFNLRKDKYCFVLENITDEKFFVVYSGSRYMEHGEVLAKMLYGEDILDDDDQPVKHPEREMETILDMVKTFNKKGKPWHHHILFPECMFNNHPGKWCIFFEDQGNIVESVFDTEPKEEVRNIEMMYYAQKK